MAQDTYKQQVERLKSATAAFEADDNIVFGSSKDSPQEDVVIELSSGARAAVAGGAFAGSISNGGGSVGRHQRHAPGAGRGMEQRAAGGAGF